MSPAWKDAERSVAKALGGWRTPLSGSSSRHTSGDLIHPVFYAEVKYRARHAILTLMREVEAKAKREGKTPLLVLKERGRHGFYVLVSLDYFTQVIAPTTPLPTPPCEQHPPQQTADCEPQ